MQHCGMLNPLWYSDENAGNSDLIYEEHNIPIYFEEEVIAMENEEPANSISEPKIQKSITVAREQNKTIQTQKSGSQTGSHTPTSTNFKPFCLNDHTMKIFKNKIKAIQKRRAQALAREKKQRPKKIKIAVQSSSISKHSSAVPSLRKQSATPTSSISTSSVGSLVRKSSTNFHYKPKPLVDPSKSGEILRMEKADSDDIEVDILSNSEDEDIEPFTSYQMSSYPEIEEDEEENDEDDSGSEDNLPSNEKKQEQINNQNEIDEEDEDNESATTSFTSTDDPDGNLNESILDSSNVVNDEETINKLGELKICDEATYKLMESNEIPVQEMIIDPNEISQIERFMHAEFFTGRSSTKSPKRYLRIRNHIICMWQQCKPFYLSKTAARQGLKKCGDVNTISRVHLTLENLGIINFGCVEVKWILPLKILYGLFQQSIRNKNQSSFSSRSKHSSFSLENNDPSSDFASNDSMVNRIKSRTHSRTQFELIKCQRYSKENVAPFEISITLSCLLCLYFHSLSSKLEIMGFIGGHIDKNNGRTKISLKCYKPCRTSISTSISAEMCPVSQVEQSTDLLDSGFELLGWFHSHPTFPATPSRTDLKTQNEIQLQFAPNNPFIGFILSCLHMDFK